MLSIDVGFVNSLKSIVEPGCRENDFFGTNNNNNKSSNSHENRKTRNIFSFNLFKLNDGVYAIVITEPKHAIRIKIKYILLLLCQR